MKKSLKKKTREFSTYAVAAKAFGVADWLIGLRAYFHFTKDDDDEDGGRLYYEK